MHSMMKNNRAEENEHIGSCVFLHLVMCVCAVAFVPGSSAQPLMHLDRSTHTESASNERMRVKFIFYTLYVIREFLNLVFDAMASDTAAHRPV